MLSHDLARELLKRRNHDLRFVVEVCLPGNDEDGDLCTTDLADDRERVRGTGKEVEVLAYSSEDDVLDVMLGTIFAGRQGSYHLAPKEVTMVIRALDKKIWAIDHVGANPALSRQFSELRKRIIDATK